MDGRRCARVAFRAPGGGVRPTIALSSIFFRNLLDSLSNFCVISLINLVQRLKNYCPVATVLPLPLSKHLGLYT